MDNKAFESFPFEVEGFISLVQSFPLEMENYRTLCCPFKVHDSGQGNSPF
jgi:hypothetical protein